jgi:hypothetical protein
LVEKLIHKEENMAERMTEQEFEQVLHKMLTYEHAPGLPEEHYIRGVLPIRDHAGAAASGPGLVVTLNNGAVFEISIHKSRLR